MKRGVGVHVEGLEPAESIRRQLQGLWGGVLSEQDGIASWRGHYTVMNKMDDEVKIERCLEELRTTFEGCGGAVSGLSLWRYDRGWWRSECQFLFET